MTNYTKKENHPSPCLPPDWAFVVQFSNKTVPLEGAFVGRAEHIRSGQALHFQSMAELVTFFEQVIAATNWLEDSASQ